MAQTLGEKLRQAREERGVSISEVAEQTRISPLYIESIEKDNYKPLPGGIFNKGFVKSYAKYIGVDEQEALRDYADLMSHTEAAAPVEQPRSYRPEVLTDDRPISAMLPTIVIAAVILGVMSAAILFLVNYIRNRESQPAVATDTANSAPPTTQISPSESPANSTAGAPTFGSAKIDLRVTDAVYLSTTVDGRSSETQVDPSQTPEFTPKDSLRLKYHVSRANFVSMLIDGKPIELPKEPSNPKRSTIELEINKDNFPQIWQSGKYVAPEGGGPASPASSPRPAGTPRPTASVKPTPSPAKPGPSPAARPANAAPRPTPR